MKAILVYGSCYGSTRRYAEELSRRTGWPACPVQDHPDLTPYDTVVHLGGLYAEKVMGLGWTAGNLPAGAKLIVVTVGLGDPAASAARRDAGIRKQLPDGTQAESFHLRGALDMKKLTLRHRLMLKAFWAVTAIAAGKEAGSAAGRSEQADYVNFSDLEPLAERLQA